MVPPEADSYLRRLTGFTTGQEFWVGFLFKIIKFGNFQLKLLKYRQSY